MDAQWLQRKQQLIPTEKEVNSLIQPEPIVKSSIYQPAVSSGVEGGNSKPTHMRVKNDPMGFPQFTLCLNADEIFGSLRDEIVSGLQPDTIFYAGVDDAFVL